jgi:hypothetical protein
LAAIFFGMNMIPYLVSEFAKSTLTNLVKESFGSDFPDIFRKEQIEYIYRYLNDLKAKTILLEFNYIDRDYLEDYSRYYVKRFSSSGSKCARLHFFSNVIDHRTIERALSQPTNSDLHLSLAESYLGFMVVKPLPKTFIGRTCLRTYPDINNGCSKKVLSRLYEVDLFGIKLSVESIAFQEQDKVVAACATTAIWSSLHATKSRPVRNIPACSEITIGAINHVDGSSNSFPSKELSNKQILRALDLESLRNHHQPMDDISQDDFLKIVRYHIDSDVPLILGANVYTIKENGELEIRAGHAVSVLGYKLSTDPALYIHDDRLGPYARATFTNLQKSDLLLKRNNSWGLVLQEKDDSGAWRSAHEVLVPSSLIIPTHKKVRLPYSFAETTSDFIVKEYERWLCELAKEGRDTQSIVGKVKYKIRLSEISALRQEIINYDFGASGNPSSTDIDLLNKAKVKFLTKSYARFHWVADFYFGSDEAFQILFDATDIPQGDAVAGIFLKSIENSNAILQIFKKYAESRDQIEVPQTENFYVSFLKNLQGIETGYFDYLDSTYGELRAPLYLKGNETAGGIIAHNTSKNIYRLECGNTLENEFPEVNVDDPDSFMIWAVAYDGALLIGKEVNGVGHPGLTGFKPARIAGELHKRSDKWIINSKSGRYSKDYANSNDLLGNAVAKFNSVFYKSRGQIVAEYFNAHVDA